MLKRCILSALLLFAVLTPRRAEAQAACTPGYESVDPSAASVDAALSAIQSVPGAVVICLAAGSVTYDGTPDWYYYGDKAIEIRGAGAFPSPWGSAGLTNIYVHSAGGGISGRPSTHGNVTISNIRWTMDGSSPQLNYALILISAGEPASLSYPVILHHNDFILSGFCNQAKIILDAAPGGVIYRNKFILTPYSGCDYDTTNINAIQHIVSDIPGGSSNASLWASLSTLGSVDDGTNNLYVETNYFEGFGVAVDQNTSSRIVWRFNEMHSSANVDHGYDSSAQGERHSEIYNNTFYCDVLVKQNGAWIYKRGGTGMIFNNTFAMFDTTCGYPNGDRPSLIFNQFKLFQGEEINGWPGEYPGTYPVSHQTGWGWIMADNQTVGDDTAQAQPGGSGFQQALEPIYVFNNTNNNTNGFLSVGGGAPQLGAMSYSNWEKASGTTLVLTGAYVNTGQVIGVVMADLVGGSAPTITDDCNGGQTWNSLQGGTSGSMRLTAWYAVVNATCRPTVTLHFTSSSSARAATYFTLRGMTASPLDKNPAVVTDNTNTYDGPSTGTLSQANEIVLGYYALNGPTVFSGTSLGSDAISAVNPWARGVYNGNSSTGVGIAGTSGGADNTNVVVGVIWRAVTATTAQTPSLQDTTADRNGLAGTVSFKLTGPTAAQNNIASFIAADREYYLQTGSFDGTSGTGSGPRASRPATCTTGVAWWSTDQGSWNNSGSGGQGVLDKCTAANTWTNAWYVPYDYPNPLVITDSDFLQFTTQPTDVTTGGTFSPTVVVTVRLPNGTTDTSASGDVTVAINGCGATLTGTTTRAASMGVATFTSLGATVGSPASGCTLTASYSGTATGATSDTFSVNSASTPTLTRVFPPIAVRGQTFPITLTGTNLNTGNASVAVDGSGFTCSNVVVGSATSLTASCTIGSGALTTIRSITVTTDTGTSGGVNFTVLNQGLRQVRSR